MEEERQVLLELIADGTSMEEGLGASDTAASSLEEAFTALLGAAEALSGSMDGLAEALAGVSVEFDNLAGSSEAASASIAGTSEALAANTTAVDENTAAHDAHNASIAEMGTAAGKAVMPLAVATAAVAGLSAVSLHMAGDFQAGIITLVTGASEAQSNIGLISTGIQQLAMQTGESTQQLIAGMFMIESTGHHGADGLNVLRMAAEGAKVGNADLGDVANALTTILTNYPHVVNGAAGATNDLIAIVANGKAHMADLATSISGVLPAAAKYGVSLQDASAALAEMTMQNGNAATSVTYLRQLLTGLASPTAAAQKALASVGLSAEQVSHDMKISLPDTIKEITDAIGRTFPAGSLQAQEAFKNIAGGAKQMQGMLLLSGAGMPQFKADVDAINKAIGDGGKQVAGWSLVQTEFNHQLSQMGTTAEVTFQQLGTALMPAAEAIIGTLTPALMGLGTWISQHGPLLVPIILGLAGVLGTALVAALSAVAVAGVAAMAPFLPMAAIIVGVIAGVAALGVGFKLAYDHIAPFHAAVNQAGTVLHAFVGEVMERAGPALHNIGLALQALGTIWMDVWPTLRDILVGVWEVIRGEIEVAWSIISGIVKVGLDLLGGNWGQAWTDIQSMFSGIWDGITLMFGGYLQMITAPLHAALTGIQSLWGTIWGGVTAPFVNAWNSIISTVSGAVATLKHWFDLAYQHSYVFKAIVDFIHWQFVLVQQGITLIWSGISTYLVNLWNTMKGQALALWSDLVTGITGFGSAISSAVQGIANLIKQPFTGMVNALKQVGGYLMQALIDGITGYAGAVTSAAQHVGNTMLSGLKNLLGIHSPSTVFAELGQNMAHGLVQGFTGVNLRDALSQHVQGSITGVQQAAGAPIVPHLPPGGGALAGGLGPGGPASASAQAALVGVLGQLAAALPALAAAGNQGTIGGARPVPATLGGVTMQFSGSQFNGVNDIASLFSQLNALAGLAVENGARGTLLGVGF